ncbi:MAG: DUF1080 domain-containing protein [Phycisphaerales bacterium]|nr:DUF1080 domain-containing protein [Phycisphaerae bacterium]NNF42172.1 DUF1080 domain-containing protein [Phycisphaerales bacterium]NNM24417.1 DUF1080 domain-containing protein [Phycisphaerales bacterium]
MLQAHSSDTEEDVAFRNVWAVPLPPRPSKAADAGGFVDLFDGRTLAGWRQLGGGAVYTVEDDAIVGRTRPREPNSFLCTDADYGDFVLELEFMVDDKLNSGVQIRSQGRPEGGRTRVFGYQVEIDPSPRAWSAGIYDEGRRGWLKNLAENTPGRVAFRPRAWNRLRVEARGPRMRTFLNGIPAADLEDDMTPAGFIGLQVHGVGNRVDPLAVRWRRIRLRPLGSENRSE